MTKILIIEDDDALRIGIRDLLEANNYSIFTTGNGKEGLNLIEAVKPDIILCDIMMDSVDGYEVKKELDKKMDTSLIPFIFLTAKADIKDIRIGMQLGADDYIVKPFDSIDLLNSIKIRLEKNKWQKETRQTDAKDKAIENKNKLSAEEHIFINSKGKPKFILVSEIKCITSSGNNSSVYVEGGLKLQVRRTLKKWEELLPENTFKRVHKSTIINMKYIKNISKWSSGTLLLHMKDMNETFIISQRYAKLIRTKLK